MKRNFYNTTARNCFLALLSFLFIMAHPFYVSVTDLKFNDAKKTMEISCKLFTNDIEGALKKATKLNLDVLHPKDKKQMDAALFSYIKDHFKLSVNGKAVSFSYIGYEKNEDAIIVYMEAGKAPKPSLVRIENTLLYDYLSSQINIVHMEVAGQKQSFKVTNPDKDISFEFK
ncbi:MAG: DUF6702 family protein [Bacteroidia bacterium]